MVKICLRTPPYEDDERTKNIAYLPGVPRIGDFIEATKNWKRLVVTAVVWVPEKKRAAFPPEIFVKEADDRDFPAPKITSKKKPTSNQNSAELTSVARSDQSK